MKVLFCDNSLRNFINFRGDVMQSFLQKGHEVVLIVPQMAGNESVALPKGIRLYELQFNPNSINPIADIKFLISLWKIYRKERPNIAFHYTIKPNIYGTVAAKLARIKAVAMVAGLGYMFTDNSLKKRIGRGLYKMALRLANKVFVLNEANKKILLEQRFVTPKRVHLMKSGEGVNLQKFPYREKDFTNTRFLMIARVLYDKGYTEFVEAAAILKEKYPTTEVSLLGPMAEDSLMGVPRSVVLGDVEAGKIKYLGETSDVPSYLKQDGIIVVVSSYHEGLNRSLMEACAMGCPSITTNIPGCREIVEHEYNGLLVPIKDTKSLADAMIRMVETPTETKQQYSRNAFTKAKREFSVDTVISTYWDIINEIMN